MANKEIIAAKEALVNEVAEKIQKSKSVVLVNHCGLTVEQDTALRVEMRKAGVEYKVIKNKILVRAFEKCGFTGYEKVFEGPTAVAFSYEDTVAGAKVAVEGGQKTKMLELKGGIIEGKSATIDELKVLASIPPKPVLLAQLLGVLTAPMRNLAVVISEIAKKSA
ncbi:MAG: 50S ribosomal protein L10 [Clostridia bacterium]|nr:50S ribosomal protein L10 [Clostridia bacterium]MBR6788629.1 50S ribosomal protein L10 [Clostridia bacterium]